MNRLWTSTPTFPLDIEVGEPSPPCSRPVLAMVVLYNVFVLYWRRVGRHHGQGPFRSCSGVAFVLLLGRFSLVRRGRTGCRRPFLGIVLGVVLRTHTSGTRRERHRVASGDMGHQDCKVRVWRLRQPHDSHFQWLSIPLSRCSIG